MRTQETENTKRVTQMKVNRLQRGSRAERNQS